MAPSNLLVLAGGFGTRLRSAVPELPKALAPVIGRPYLYYLMESWRIQGVKSLIFLLHHQSQLIETFLQSYRESSPKTATFDIRALTEPHPLGTGGAVAYAVREMELTGSFLATNADTWLGSGIQAVGDAQAPAVALVRVNDSDRYGKVLVERGVVAEFEEKRAGAGVGWINAGLYHLNADLFHAWDGRAFSLERELFPKLAGAAQLSAVALNTDFIDIGVPEDYLRFCRWIESGKSRAL
jgi:D-glycero-alpha-D-manno-heptose 1-phosphate guanylyltransferase